MFLFSSIWCYLNYHFLTTGKVLPAKGKVPFLARGVWKGFGPKKHSMRTLCQIVCASRNTKSSITHLCVDKLVYTEAPYRASCPTPDGLAKDWYPPANIRWGVGISTCLTLLAIVQTTLLLGWTDEVDLLFCRLKREADEKDSESNYWNNCCNSMHKASILERRWLIALVFMFLYIYNWTKISRGCLKSVHQPHDDLSYFIEKISQNLIQLF